ncbi:MAG: hypothetical protein ACI3Y2_04160 [Candidatus Egerieousia sp.]
MKFNIKAILALAAGAFLCLACAEEKDESQRSIQERVLDAYIETKCPDAQKLPSGLTIINKSQGAGELPESGDAVYIHYSTYSLNGVCQSTTDSVEARMLGTYDASKYYGPSLFVLGTYSVTQGMSELLQLIGENGTVTAIIPPWLTSYDNSQTGGSMGGQQSTINVIYKVNLRHVIKDLTKFQADSLDSYSRLNFSPKIDSLSYGYYFRNFTHDNGIDAADTIASGTSVNIWYVGRLLDGYIFDTNIRDTAKKYGIYNSSGTYDPLKVTIESTYKEMSSNGVSSDGSTGSLVSGFARALKKMTIKDHAVTFFMSGFGYGNSGTMSSGKGVPEYAMLRFDIWMGKSGDENYPPVKEKDN